MGPHGSRENRHGNDAESVDRGVELLINFRNRGKRTSTVPVEILNDLERRRRWAAQVAERKRTSDYQSAKDFALDLHSDQGSQRREEEEEEEEVKRWGKGIYQETMKAIKNGKMRRIPISPNGFKLNLRTEREAPTLLDLSLKVLANNSEAIKSLNLVPDHLRKKLSNLVSNLGKVDSRFMQLLIQDSPSEISVRNCIHLEEKDLTQILCQCDTDTSRVLVLDLCGRGMTENAISDFLKRSPKGFPSLTTLSLQGAFCLTDNALALISRSAPLLRFINLSNCSLLTSNAVKILSDNFESTLRGLNIGGCQGIKPTSIFKNSLVKFRELNYLSVTGLESINDVVIWFLTSRGSNLTDLSLAFCNDLSEELIWTVGNYCPKLETLDMSGLDYLSNMSLGSIAEGCRYLNSVELTQTRFSDIAIAAFLEVSGGSLSQLSLNHARNVGQHTAISLANVCKRLRYLDLSWCRKLTEKELRQILCCCSSLRSVKLFGWTQVKDEFLEELSKSQVHITGLKMTSVFARLDDSYPSIDAKFF